MPQSSESPSSLQDEPISRETAPRLIKEPWGKLSWFEKTAVALFVITLSAATLPYLPAGVCFSDGGDLQLAASTLGIMHPPGYAGYVSILHLFTWMPGVEPAFMVTLVCWFTGVIALTLGVLIQIRLGVHAWIAGALVLSLVMWKLSKPYIWNNLVSPEIYAPSLALTLGTIYGLMRHVRLGEVRDLYIAAGLYGLVLANRPTLIYFLPFILGVWVMGKTSWGVSWVQAWKRLGLCVLIVSMPCLYSLGYFLIRDHPQTAYNYMEHYNREFQKFPDVSTSYHAKGERLMWHLTARQYARFINSDPQMVWQRVKKIYKLFFLYRPWSFLFLTAVLTIGGGLVYQRNPSGFVLMMGLLIANVLFFVTYRINGQAGDLSPLLMFSIVLLGVFVSVVFPRTSHPAKNTLAICCLLVSSGLLLWKAPEFGKRTSEDATHYIHDIDMSSLPPNSVICATWRESPTLRYAKHVMTKRKDITIVNTATLRWLERSDKQLARPLFSVRKKRELEAYTHTPYRQVDYQDSQLTILWQLHKPAIQPAEDQP